ncbi:hypothetical protein VMCG_01358 [Cytospora schulzeri]|uniref:Uncharacterized protein n=1 Tax=Cytospora schulzeri TaxID=448051 RepID=A0A423X7K7_9PEZI|nr:hypothetical protein VMCG_01358 [Valsa malicola]
MASSFSSQVNNAFRTPTHSIDNRQLGRDWKRDFNDETSIWDDRVGAGHSWNIPKIDVNNIPTTPPDEILSPQPKQCVQKILKLTGKISPTASVSSVDSPTLHNSQQKIKQLTGLDVGLGGTNHNQLHSLHALQDDVSPISLSSSMYSQDGLETAISELEKESSEYSYRYMDDEFNEVTTPLSPPNFKALSTRPLSTAPVSPTSTPAALRLSDFRGGNHTEILSQLDEPQHHQDSGAEWASYRESSPSDRVIDLYHSTTNDIAKGSAPPLGTKYSAAAWSPPPAAAERRSVLWGSKPSEIFQRSRLNLSSSSSLPPAAVDSRPSKTDSFSDRRASSRNRVPPPLEQAREAPKPGRNTLPQRTPYPLPSPSLMSAFDEDDSRKRFSLLSKVFSSSSSKNRVSSASRGSSVQSPREDRSSAAAVPVHSSSAHRIEGPDAPWAAKSTASAAASSSGRPAPAGLGVFQRTMESARQSVGLKSKAEKRRQGLKGKIRVVGPEELGGVAGTGPRQA